jgi:hypothetical protein
MSVSAFQRGDWVMFYRDDALVLGQVQEAMHEAPDFPLVTTAGRTTGRDVVEIRRERTLLDAVGWR